jgi:hypothetical protein
MTTAYTPRSGSSCDKALQAIRSHGQRVSERALAIAMDCEPDEVGQLLGYPIRLGAIKRDRDEVGVWYDEGDGVPLSTLPPIAPPKMSHGPRSAFEVAAAAAQAETMRDAEIAPSQEAPPELPAAPLATPSLDIPQFVKSSLRRMRSAGPLAAAQAELHQVDAAIAEGTPAGGGRPALPVSRAPAIYPLEAEHSFEFPIPNKANARITLPADFDARDWKMLQAVITAFANRLSPVAS